MRRNGQAQRDISNIAVRNAMTKAAACSPESPCPVANPATRQATDRMVANEIIHAALVNLLSMTSSIRMTLQPTDTSVGPVLTVGPGALAGSDIVGGGRGTVESSSKAGS